MNDQQIQEIADRIIQALNNLAPGEPTLWTSLVALTPLAALTAAVVAAVVGYKNLRQQQRALNASVRSDARNLRQKREADTRSEWWRRTQWALEAAASDNTTMYGYGAGMLDLLAQSELAGPHDKALLDAVWEVTSTEMEDDSIKQLIQDAREQDDLSYEEVVSLMSFTQADFDKHEELKEQARNMTSEQWERLVKFYAVESEAGEEGHPEPSKGDHEDPKQGRPDDEEIDVPSIEEEAVFERDAELVDAESTTDDNGSSEEDDNAETQKI